jgi:hypothetical protein
MTGSGEIWELRIWEQNMSEPPVDLPPAPRSPLEVGSIIAQLKLSFLIFVLE